MVANSKVLCLSDNREIKYDDDDDDDEDDVDDDDTDHVFYRK